MHIETSVIEICKSMKASFAKQLTTHGVTFEQYQMALLQYNLGELKNEVAEIKKIVTSIKSH